MEKLNEKVKTLFGSWVKFAKASGQNSSNFKRKIATTVARLNGWLAPLNLEAHIREKN